MGLVASLMYTGVRALLDPYRQTLHRARRTTTDQIYLVATDWHARQRHHTSSNSSVRTVSLYSASSLHLCDVIRHRLADAAAATTDGYKWGLFLLFDRLDVLNGG